MAGAFLFPLLDKTNARRREQRADLIRLMTYHDGDVIGGRDGAGGCDDVLNQRQAARAMQHLGALGLHARPEAGGQDHDVDLRFHPCG